MRAGQRQALDIYLWSRAAIWVAAIFAFFFFEPNRHPNAARWDTPRLHDLGYFTDIWARWDSTFFLRIAQNGYDDASAAFCTLHSCLVAVSQLLAPFTPFVAEAIWGNLAAGRDGRPESVHLSDYPSPDETAVDDALEHGMRAARAIVELGRRVRVETKTKVRQPLREAVVHYAGDHTALQELLSIVADELNVKRIEFAESVEELGRWHAKPNYKVLGRTLGSRVKALAAALESDDGSLAGALAGGRDVTIAVGGVDTTLHPGDVDLSQETRKGWGVASEAGVTVALDLDITAELRLEGIARDLVRAVQDARKAAGFDVSDRISLGVEASGDILSALAAHRDRVASETLATEIVGDSTEGFEHAVEIDGVPVTVSVRRA